MQGHVRWRDATPADRDLMARLDAGLAAHFDLVPDLTPEQRHALVAMQTRAREQAWRATWPDADCQVIEAGSRGGTQAIGRLRVNRGASGMRLIEIALLPAQRGQGLGTECLRRLLDEACAAGLDLTLEVSADNPVRHLYQRLGFDVVAEHPPYLRMRKAASAEPVSFAETCYEQA